MKILKFDVLVVVLFMSLVTLMSCRDEDDRLFKKKTNVTVTNTLVADINTGGVETSIEILFGMEEGALAATAEISDDVEFSAYLLGLYDIDIDRESISFELVAPLDDPTYMNFFRTLEAGTTDRYYLNFEDGHNVTGFTSDDSSVGLRIDSDKILVVEIGEGFSFNPGSSFTLDLN